MGKRGRRGLAVISAAVFLAGCEGRQLPTAFQGASAPEAPSAWSPKHQALLYASTEASVRVFLFPSGKPHGTLQGFYRGFTPKGICTDRAGHVFVTGGIDKNAVYEFEHGGSTPIATFADQYGSNACAADPNSGDFAICSTDFYAGNARGEVAIYSKASGSPKYYAASGGAEFGYCGYDDASNLYVSQTYYASLQELPKGASGFQTIPISGHQHAWSLQPYAGGFALSSLYDKGNQEYVFRAKIQSGEANIVSTMALTNPRNKPSTSEFWISGSYIAGSGNRGNGLFLWKYPGGGEPVKEVAKGKWAGVAVSP